MRYNASGVVQPLMSWWVALVLGVVEGLTEYLPVSSTAHLILAQRALGIVASEEANAFAICVQLGAIAAVLGVFFARVRSMALGVLGRDPAGRSLAINVTAHTSGATMTFRPNARPYMNDTDGFFSVSVRCVSSTTSILSSAEIVEARVKPGCVERMRSSENFTSAAVTLRPFTGSLFSHFASGMVMFTFSGSGCSTVFAKSGAGLLVFASICMRPREMLCQICMTAVAGAVCGSRSVEPSRFELLG